MDTFDKNDIDLMNHDVKLSQLADEHSDAQFNHKESIGKLEALFSELRPEILQMTGKKFIGKDSRLCVLLDYAYVSTYKEIADKIKELHSKFHTSDGEIEGLKGKMTAKRYQIDLLRSKMSYEKAQTGG